MFENKYFTQLKNIIIAASAIYVTYLIILSIALITHTQIFSSIVILAVITTILIYFLSLKHNLYPISAILSVYLFQTTNLLTLNSHYTLNLFLDSYNLGFAAFFFEPWLLLIATLPSIIGHRKYIKTHPQKKKITFK